MDQRDMEMKDQLNIVCFLWHGDRWNENDSGALYVNRLHNAIQRNLSLPHRFICLTNIPEGIHEGIDILPLDAPSWLGCLPKVCMFNPDLGLEGQVFSIDLDVIITGSLDEMCSYRGNFATRSSFAPGKEHEMDGDIVGFKVGFGVDIIWEPMKNNTKEVERLTGGRERYHYRQTLGMINMDRWQTLFPAQIFSYKRHVRKFGLHKNARIVSCHGKPRPHEIQEQWAKQNWK